MSAKFLLITAVATFAGLGALGWKMTARGAYETAEYSVVEQESPFEIREYPALTLVSTGMKAELQGSDGSFMRLFRYITGANEQNQEIAMTTPVFMEGMANSSQGEMGFVLPREIAKQGAPKPSDGAVQIHTRPAGRFAVIRFAGRLDQESVASAEKKLREWIAKKGWTARPETEFAGYDPPWTPGPLRRNEVLIRLDKQPTSSPPADSEMPAQASP